MDSGPYYEIVGYAASFLIVVSMMMGNILRLRIINLIGASTFAIYGILIGSIPVAATNAFIICINIYYLVQMIGSDTYFRPLIVSSQNEYLLCFIEYYQEDIQKFQPDIPINLPENSLNIFILRDMVPAGLVSGRITSTGIFTIDIDYVIPRYRDFRIGKFLFQEHKDFFREQNISEIHTFAFKKTHITYLTRIGFTALPETGQYILKVN